MMNQLSRAATKSSHLIRTAHQNNRFPLKLFSTEPSRGSSDDLSLRTPPKGLVYGRVNNVTKHTTKTDIINLLEGSNLKPNNLKVEYTRSYIPMSMMVEFPSQSDYDAALKAIGRKGRLFNISRADRAHWDAVAPFDGKAILLQGIPRNALFEDVERFLSGCQYDSSSVQMFLRVTNEGPTRMALVRFPSEDLAVHAYITKNRGFCLNSQISLQLLY